MADYALYADLCKIRQIDMVRTIQANGWPRFGKTQMSLAANPINALQLVPAAEEVLVRKFGEKPGLSISPKVCNKKSHENKNKPNRLCVRLGDNLRSRVQEVYDRMCFSSMQDLIEAAIAEFVEKHSR